VEVGTRARRHPQSATPTPPRGRGSWRRCVSALPGVAGRRSAALPRHRGWIRVFAATTDRDDRGEWLTLRDLGNAPRRTWHAGLFPSAIAFEAVASSGHARAAVRAPTVDSNAGWRRTCTNDGSQHFPLTDPAVIMLIHAAAIQRCSSAGKTGEQPLLDARRLRPEAGGRSRRRSRARWFRGVGVADHGHPLLREPAWPFPSSLHLLGCGARLDGDPGSRSDPVEMAEAHWFTRDEVRSPG